MWNWHSHFLLSRWISGKLHVLLFYAGPVGHWSNKRSRGEGINPFGRCEKSLQTTYINLWLLSGTVHKKRREEDESIQISFMAGSRQPSRVCAPILRTTFCVSRAAGDQGLQMYSQFADRQQNRPGRKQNSRGFLFFVGETK